MRYSRKLGYIGHETFEKMLLIESSVGLYLLSCSKSILKYRLTTISSFSVLSISSISE